MDFDDGIKNKNKFIKKIKSVHIYLVLEAIFFSHQINRVKTTDLDSIFIEVSLYLFILNFLFKYHFIVTEAINF